MFHKILHHIFFDAWEISDTVKAKTIFLERNNFFSNFSFQHFFLKEISSINVSKPIRMIFKKPTDTLIFFPKHQSNAPAQQMFQSSNDHLQDKDKT